MRRPLLWLIAGTAIAAVAIPVVAQQQAPESLLPDDFGAPVSQPTQPVPQPGSPQPGAPAPSIPQPIDLAAPEEAANNAEEEKSAAELAAEKAEYDFPDSARRLLTRVGPLTPATRGLAPDAFGGEDGRFLTTLMRETKAPFASRWGSILLRRALLSATDTPRGVEGADWTAERAWLLLRMGEADAARMLIQSVDVNNYTPRLYAVAMQSYLATADPAGLCPLAEGALRVSKEPGWEMSRAFCAAFAGDQGMASGILSQARRDKVARGIDYRLAEKVVGAGNNARRSVKIEWEGVDSLTAWRFGLATAVNVAIPDDLYTRAGPHVRAWQARSAMLALPARRTAVETAARLGVYSSAALVDFYSELAADDGVPADFKNRANALRDAYVGGTVGDRLDGMHALWARPDGEDGADYLGLIATARAAAAFPVSRQGGSDLGRLIAAMLTAGYDRSAMRWAGIVSGVGAENAGDAWALLAVGSPARVVDVAPAQVTAFAQAAGERRGRMFIAGLAALGRLSQADAAQAAADAGLSFTPRTRWAQAIAAAAGKGEQATVALLAGVGMQVSDWGRMPPEHLYHIVSALRRVGLEPEARMIAAEALTRA